MQRVGVGGNSLAAQRLHRQEVLEPRVRRLVADHLGVAREELAPEVSLVDDLAADSLDLLEVALALEAEFDIVIPERTVDEVRTYGDLVDAVTARVAGPPHLGAMPALVRTRLVPAGSESRGSLERVGWLTPYARQTISDDAVRAGRGARLEITVSAIADEDAVARVREQFAWLGERGVRVSVGREHASDGRRRVAWSPESHSLSSAGGRQPA